MGLTSLDRYAILLSPRFEVLKGTHLPDEPPIFDLNQLKSYNKKIN
jgi:hypothetical protein